MPPRIPPDTPPPPETVLVKTLQYLGQPDLASAALVAKGNTSVRLINQQSNVFVRGVRVNDDQWIALPGVIPQNCVSADPAECKTDGDYTPLCRIICTPDKPKAPAVDNTVSIAFGPTAAAAENPNTVLQTQKQTLTVKCSEEYTYFVVANPSTPGSGSTGYETTGTAGG
jgi:hypothetical protein